MSWTCTVPPALKCASRHGAADARRPHQPLRPDPVRLAGAACWRRWHDRIRWRVRRPLFIALAALRWILTLLVSTDRAGDLTIPGSKKQGTTMLQPAALTGALTREIGTYHGVQGVKSRIIGHASDPEIVVTVTAGQTADLAALCRRVESEALDHARQALGNADLPIQLDLEVSRRPA